MSSTCTMIIDSCSDLPFEVINQPGIKVLNFPYTLEGKEYFDDFYQSSCAHDFFERMRKGATPKTAQVPLMQIRALLETCAQEGNPCLYLGFSSELSGNFSTVELMAEEIRQEYPDFELYVLDTKLGSVALALLVYEALELRKQGMTAQELYNWASEARYFVNALFMLDDLEALKRGGRIPASIAYAGSKLDVKPLLGFKLDGSLTLVSVARGRKKGLKSLVEFYNKYKDESQPSQNIVLADADCPQDLQKLMDLLTKADESLLFLESSIGPVIGSHVGPGMIACVFWGRDRREELSVADRIARKVRAS